MAEKLPKPKPVALLLVMALVTFFLPFRSWAQESSPQTGSVEKAQQAPDTAAPSNPSQTDPDSTVDYTPLIGGDAAQTLVTQMPVGRLGGPGSLSPEGSPLHLGPIYDTYFSMFYVVGSGLLINPITNQLSTQINNAGVFHTTLVYDRLVSRNRLALQYSPELLIINGKVEQNLSNQAISLDTVYLLSPRWSVWLGNAFSSQSGAMISDDPTLEVDTESGQTSQNPFLRNSNRYYSDRSAATFRYMVGSRDTLVLTPSFQYQHTDLNNLPISSYTIGGTAEWNHALSNRRSFGLSYAESYLKFSRALPNALSTAFGGGYSYIFAPTWLLSLSLGANTVGATGGRVWSYTGGVGLYKSFTRSSVALQYYRGLSVGPFLSDRVGSQVSVNYSVHLLRRLRAEASASYQEGNTSEGVAGRTNGTYYTGQVTWQLTSRMLSFVNYGQRNERGDNIDPIAGRHFAVTTGIRWEAQRKTSY